MWAAGNLFKIKVAAPLTNDKASKDLAQFFANQFAVKQQALTIVVGSINDEKGYR